MTNIEYYDRKRADFESVYNNFTACDTAALNAVRVALAEQEKADERAYAENEDLEVFVANADCMSIENVEDFDEYLSFCLGGRVSDGVNMLKANNRAFYANTSLVEVKRPAPIVKVDNSPSDNIVWKEKRVTKTTWNRIDGFKKHETVVSVPMSKRELERKITWMDLFSDKKTVSVKDKKTPSYSIVAIVLCMIICVVPIFLSIINNEVSVQNKEYDAYIRSLNAEIEELNSEIAMKKDMELINRLAREEYGMIDIELSQIKRVECAEDIFVIKNTEDKPETNVWVTLLSAIGIVGED